MTTERVRKGRKARHDTPPARAVDYARLRNPFVPQAIFSADEVAAIHDTALRVLQELGISVLLPEARQILARAGASVDDLMVRIGRDQVAEALRTAPRSIPMRAANSRFDLTYELGALMFTSAGGCPNVMDRVQGRRAGNLASYHDAVKLVGSFDALHKQTVAPEPQDVPIQLRHLAMTEAQLTLADKHMAVYARGRGQVEQSFALIREALALSEADWSGAVWASTVINSNSPRMLDLPMAQGIIDFARARQMTIITPFCLAGAMAPITVAGALVLQHAEALAGITLAQMTNPGAPVSYGGFSSNVHMKSGSPAFGTPEHLKMQLGAGQLARLIGLPWRSAAGSAGNTTDSQSAHENIMGLWGAFSAGATMVIHSAGWLEGGLTFGFEKLICDMEAVQVIAELCAPTAADEAARAFDAIAEVPPGGHFFAAAHTMERFGGAFYEPLIADLSNHGTWTANGSQTAEVRATAKWQAILRDWRAPEGAAERAARIAPLLESLRKAGGADLLSG